MMSEQIDPQNLRPPDHFGEHFEEGEEAAPPGARTMAIVRWGLIGLMALAAVGSVVYFFGGFHRTSAAQAGIQYYCPMHPSIVQDHPGECPICSMTLVPREQGAKASAPAVPSSAPGHEGRIPAGLGPIDLTPERIQLLGMRTAQARRQKLNEELRTVGYVSANEK